MESSAPPKEWRELDSWWTAFTESTSAVSTSEMTRRFDDGSLPSHWKVTDTWWDEYIEEHSLSEATDTSVSLDQRFTQGGMEGVRSVVGVTLQVSARRAR